MRSELALFGKAAHILKGPVSRREALYWITLIFAFSNVASRTESSSIFSFVTAFTELNLVYWCCYVAIFRAVAASKNDILDSTTISLWAVVGLLLLCFSFTSVQSLDGAVATLIALFLWRKYGNDNGLLQASIIFFALSVNLLWAPILFAILKEPIVLADTILTQGLLTSAGYEVERQVNAISVGNDFYITVIGACSVFNNISLGVLATVSLIVCFGGTPIRRDFLGAALICMLLILLNTIRLAVFASSSTAYHFWHNGDGAIILAATQTVIIFGVATLVAIRERPKLV